MRIETVGTYWARIYLSGPREVIEQVCRRDCLRQGRCCREGNTTFRCFAADVDLQADRQRRQRGWTLFGEALRNPQSVHRMHPVERLGDDARLVALQRTNEMPVQPQRT